ncbi:MAG: hypothetical protein PHV51_05560 [Methanosarcinaceae archaeon]|nr:hypothetical protein [Methanosarcinaceae archaeon]MDD4497602.1 hypothetical protein [Methanosarcinaceae archaeon]
MKKNQNFFIRFSILLQVFLILFATMGVVTATEQIPSKPDFPLLISGALSLNEKDAPPGTTIEVKLNGESLSSTVVKVKGKFGDGFGNKLRIDCAPEDYSNLEFYINNDKIEMIPIDANQADSDGFLALKIDAEISEKEIPGNNVKDAVPSNSGGGFFLTDETKVEDEGKAVINDLNVGDTNIKKPLENENPDSSSGTYAEQIPESEESSKGLVIGGVIGLLLVVGIILVSRSKNS